MTRCQQYQPADIMSMWPRPGNEHWLFPSCTSSAGSTPSAHQVPTAASHLSGRFQAGKGCHFSARLKHQRGCADESEPVLQSARGSWLCEHAHWLNTGLGYASMSCCQAAASRQERSTAVDEGLLCNAAHPAVCDSGRCSCSSGGCGAAQLGSLNQDWGVCRRLLQHSRVGQLLLLPIDNCITLHAVLSACKAGDGRGRWANIAVVHDARRQQDAYAVDTGVRMCTAVHFRPACSPPAYRLSTLSRCSWQ